jgi:hypothetical protein
MKKLILHMPLVAVVMLFYTYSTAQCITADAGPDKTICTNGQTILGTPAQPGYTYSWTPYTGLNNPNIAQPTASPHGNTTYQLIITPPNLPNLVANGNFESGNTAFQTDYLMWPQSLQLGGYGSYLISDNAINMRSYFFSSPHTSGSNLMMIVDGSTGGSAHVVWRQQVNNIVQNTFYKFSLFVSNISGNAGGINSMVDIHIRINGTEIAHGRPEEFSLAEWAKVEGLWNSGGSTTATIEVVDFATSSSSNDFALDDLEFVQACPTTVVPTDQVTVTATLKIDNLRMTSVYTQEGSGPLVPRSNNWEEVCYGWESSMKEVLTSPFTSTAWVVNDKLVTDGYYPGIGGISITNNTQTLTLYPDEMRWKEYRFGATNTSTECPAQATRVMWTTFIATYYEGSHTYVNGNSIAAVNSRNTWTNISPHLATTSGSSMFNYTFPPGIDVIDNDFYDPDLLINVTSSYAGPLYFAGADKYYIPVVASGIICPGPYNVHITVPNPFRRAVGDTPAETDKNTPTKTPGIFPNPANHFIFVQPDESFGNNYEIDIVNVMGQIVKKRKVSNQGAAVLKIAVDDLTVGVYNLIIRTGQKTVNSKFIVGR